MKNIFSIFIIGLLLFSFKSNIVVAQESKDTLLVKQFENSFALAIIYPDQLYNKCIPTMCLLKIEIQNEGRVSNLTLSDSADSLFVSEFEQNKRKIQVTLIEKYCAKRSLINKTLIVPLHYSFRKSVCPSPTIDFDLLSKYYYFKGLYLSGEFMLLPDINAQLIMHN